MSIGRSNLQTQLTAWLMRRTSTVGVRRVAPIAAAIATDVGEVRRENQDRVAIARGRDRLGRPFAIAAVADGIGGMQQGAECAALALGSLFATIAGEAIASVDPSQWLLLGIHQANNDVYARLRGAGGATISAALISGNGAIHWVSVGDSRIYVADRSLLKQISIDDTIAGQLGRAGEAGSDQSKLIQFVGIGKPLEAKVSDLAIHDGVAVFLTTDGVHFLDSTPWFSQLIKHASDPGVCVRRLIELSRWCGGPDNATAAMLSLGGPIGGGMPDIDGFLEVWDPFGELQVVAHPLSIPTSPSQPLAPVAAKTAPAGPLTPTRAKASASAENSHEAKAAGATKKGRSARKGKSTAKSEQTEKSQEGANVPQLLIEFPSKNN